MIFLTSVLVSGVAFSIAGMAFASLVLGVLVVSSKTPSNTSLAVAKGLATFFGLIAFLFTYGFWNTPMTKFKSAYDLMQTPYLLAPLFGIGVAVGAVWAWAKNSRQGILIANIFLLGVLVCVFLVRQHNS